MKKRKRKIKFFRAFMLLILVAGGSICAYQISLAYIQNKDLPTDSNDYIIPESELPMNLLEAVHKNPELRKFVSAYPEKKDKQVSIDIQDDIKFNEVSLFMQWDERWGYSTYGDGVMALTGCGPTTLSMVLVYLQKDDKWNPYEVAQYAQAHGYYEDGIGTAWALMSEGAKELGITAESIPLNENLIKQTLAAGKPIICSLAPGDFTTTGHFIVLTALSKDGRIYVHDPYRMSTTNKTWDYATLAKQILQVWAYDI